MPTERAHGIQIVKTCEALAKAGADVELVVPARYTRIHEVPEKYYGLKHAFNIRRLPVLDTVSWGRIGFFIETLSFAFASLRHIDGKTGVVYGRDEWILALLVLAGFENVVWESHTGAWNWAARYLTRRTKIVVISQGLHDFYVARGVPGEIIAVAHDGVDLSMFEQTLSKTEARKRLGFPEDAKIALYIGGVGGWKGTDTLFEASRLLSLDIRVAMIGKVNLALKAQYPNVLFVGERPYSEVADNQGAGDVLVLPTSSRSVVGMHFTSPLKLFTYMASGIPIVASDVSSTREVLPDNGAYWFTADDAESLAKTITEAIKDPQARERAQVARGAVRGYTWDTRAEAILAFV